MESRLEKYLNYLRLYGVGENTVYYGMKVIVLIIYNFLVVGARRKWLAIKQIVLFKGALHAPNRGVQIL